MHFLKNVMEKGSNGCWQGTYTKAVYTGGGPVCECTKECALKVEFFQFVIEMISDDHISGV